MKVMTGHKKIKAKNKTITLMGVDKPTHILINDTATNKNSVLVPIEDIKKILEL